MTRKEERIARRRAHVLEAFNETVRFIEEQIENLEPSMRQTRIIVLEDLKVAFFIDEPSGVRNRLMAAKKSIKRLGDMNMAVDLNLTWLLVGIAGTHDIHREIGDACMPEDLKCTKEMILAIANGELIVCFDNLTAVLPEASETIKEALRQDGVRGCWRATLDPELSGKMSPDCAGYVTWLRDFTPFTLKLAIPDVVHVEGRAFGTKTELIARATARAAELRQQAATAIEKAVSEEAFLALMQK